MIRSSVGPGFPRPSWFDVPIHNDPSGAAATARSRPNLWWKYLVFRPRCAPSISTDHRHFPAALPARRDRPGSLSRSASSSPGGTAPAGPRTSRGRRRPRTAASRSSCRARCGSARPRCPARTRWPTGRRWARSTVLPGSVPSRPVVVVPRVAGSRVAVEGDAQDVSRATQGALGPRHGARRHRRTRRDGCRRRQVRRRCGTGWGSAR